LTLFTGYDLSILISRSCGLTFEILLAGHQSVPCKEGQPPMLFFSRNAFLRLNQADKLVKWYFFARANGPVCGCDTLRLVKQLR